MMGYTSLRGNRVADWRQHERISRPERLEDNTSVRLNPVMVVAWSIMLIASIALWCGLGLAVSSLVSALV